MPDSNGQTQQLFERVAQTITPEAIENVKAALASSELEQKAGVKKKAVPRKAAGQTWEDPTLAEWPESKLACSDKFFLPIQICVKWLNFVFTQLIDLILFSVVVPIWFPRVLDSFRHELS